MFLLLAAPGCTEASESELAPMGAALGALTLPQQPLAIPTQTADICRTRPDLALDNQSASSSYPGWLYVCAPVTNVGGVGWVTASASQIGVRTTSSASGSSTLNVNGFTTLGPGKSVSRCGWMRVPDLKRYGHHEPRFGECKATMVITTRLSFDPDIANDSNPLNDDCRSTNNARTRRVPYMQACPW